MTPAEIIAACARLDVRLYVQQPEVAEGEATLLASGRTKQLDDDLKAQIRENKAVLIETLTTYPCARGCGRPHRFKWPHLVCYWCLAGDRS